MAEKSKEGSFLPIFIVMIISIMIAFFWNSGGVIKNTANLILNPTAGALLAYNVTLGMLIVTFIVSIFTTLIQKYATDQKTLKEIKAEQKKLSDESKQFRNNPEKMMEFNQKILPMSMQIMKLSMRPMVYTSIPLILFFRWFFDYFAALGDFKFFGFLSWFWFYLIGTIIFSTILRKVLKVA